MLLAADVDRPRNALTGNRPAFLIRDEEVSVDLLRPLQLLMVQLRLLSQTLHLHANGLLHVAQLASETFNLIDQHSAIVVYLLVQELCFLSEVMSERHQCVRLLSNLVQCFYFLSSVKA